MKRVSACILALFLLVAAAAPASGAAFEADAPEPALPESFAAALSDYEAMQAVRLGFIPDGLVADMKSPVTRAGAAELALRFIAMQYGYDGEHFLDLCAASAVNLPDGSRPDYVKDRFTDLDGDSAPYVNWAAALELVSGEGGGIFNPARVITQQEAAVILNRAAEFYGAFGKNFNASAVYSGKKAVEAWALGSVNRMLALEVLDSGFDPDAPCDAKWILTAFWRLYANAPVSRGKGNAGRLLSYEKELSRLLQAEGVKIHKQVVMGAGTAVYYERGGASHLDIVYKGGGCKSLPMPDETLTYLSAAFLENILYVADRSGLRYEINVSTLACTPVAAPDGISITIIGPGEEEPTSTSLPPVNEFGSPAQYEELQNGYSRPHRVNIGYMPIYTESGNEWALSKLDMALIRIKAERLQQYPAGQLIEVGYILDGEAVPMVETYLLDSASFTLRAPEDGNYRFYIRNKSLNALYIRSLSVEVFHRWFPS